MLVSQNPRWVPGSFPANYREYWSLNSRKKKWCGFISLNFSHNEHSSRTCKSHWYKQLVNLGQTWQEPIVEPRWQSTLNEKWLNCVCNHQTKATLACGPLSIWCASSEDCQVYQCRLGKYVSLRKMEEDMEGKQGENKRNKEHRGWGRRNDREIQGEGGIRGEQRDERWRRRGCRGEEEEGKKGETNKNCRISISIVSHIVRTAALISMTTLICRCAYFPLTLAISKNLYS